MKRLLFLSFICLTIFSLKAENKKEDYSYVGMEIYMPNTCPYLNIGYRHFLKNEDAVDMSLSYILFNKKERIGSIDANVSLNQYIKNNVYYGYGITGSYIFKQYFADDIDHFIDNIVIYPSFILGKSDKTIKEFAIGFPLFSANGPEYIPVIKFRYGFKF